MSRSSRLKWVAIAIVGLLLATTSASRAQQVGEETRVVAVGDAEIEYVVSGPADGEPVLLIHGAMLGTAFAPIQERLASAGYRPIRIHRRGFVGSSDDVPAQGASGHAADAVAVLNDLGVENAHVVGHSAGAAFAVRILLHTPERVRSLVLIDPAVISALFSAPPVTAQPELIGAAMAAFQAGDAETALQAFARAVFGDDWREFFDAIPGGYEQALTDARRFVLGAPQVPAVDPAQVAALDRPIRVLWAGENEQSAAAAELAASLPQAEVGAIEGTDHALITQKPREVTDDILAFIRRQSN